MALADQANRYIDDHKPWVMIKEEGREAEVQAVCTQGINLFRGLITLLAPDHPLYRRKGRRIPGHRSGLLGGAG